MIWVVTMLLSLVMPYTQHAPIGWRVLQEAYGATLPFPLKYIVPWSQQRDMAKKLGRLDAYKVGPAAPRCGMVFPAAAAGPRPCPCLTYLHPTSICPHTAVHSSSRCFATGIGSNLYPVYCHAPRMLPDPAPAPAQVYPAAVEALSAVADKLRASSGPYLLGPKPSSLDAMLFGHLAFYKHSAIAAPTLRDKVRRDMVCQVVSAHCKRRMGAPTTSAVSSDECP